MKSHRQTYIKQYVYMAWKNVYSFIIVRDVCGCFVVYLLLCFGCTINQVRGGRWEQGNIENSVQTLVTNVT